MQSGPRKRRSSWHARITCSGDALRRRPPLLRSRPASSAHTPAQARRSAPAHTPPCPCSQVGSRAQPPQLTMNHFLLASIWHRMRVPTMRWHTSQGLHPNSGSTCCTAPSRCRRRAAFCACKQASERVTSNQAGAERGPTQRAGSTRGRQQPCGAHFDGLLAGLSLLLRLPSPGHRPDCRL